uniref:Uncharacterized protein n=1 Tax=Aegilops tauschii TaxID=37682 RepID=M8B2J7_AEGTA
MERDGMWEPVIALEGGDEDNSRVRSWIHDDDDAISDSENDEEDLDFGHQRRAVVRRDGRGSGETASTMRVGSERGRQWRGHGSFSDSEGARKGPDQRWSDRSSESRRKPPAARWKPWNAEGSNAIGKDRIGGGSFSESEVSRRGFEPKSRARNREDTMDAVVKWKLSYDTHGNVIRKVRVGGEFDSNSDNGRDDKLEPKWRAPNRSSPSENRRGRAGLKHRPKANSGERPGGYTRGHNADERGQFGNGFASDLEEPTWKPRKKNEARNSNGSREYNGDMKNLDSAGTSEAAHCYIQKPDECLSRSRHLCLRTPEDIAEKTNVVWEPSKDFKHLNLKFLQMIGFLEEDKVTTYIRLVMERAVGLKKIELQGYRPCRGYNASDPNRKSQVDEASRRRIKERLEHGSSSSVEIVIC